MMTSWPGSSIRITVLRDGKSVLTVESPQKGPVMRSFGVFFLLVEQVGACTILLPVI